MNFLNNLLIKNLKCVNYFIKSSTYSTKATLAYDSDTISKFLKILSNLFEKDKTKMLKTFSEYDHNHLKNLYNHEKFIRKTVDDIEQLKIISQDSKNDNQMLSMFKKEIDDLTSIVEKAKQEFPTLLMPQEASAEQEVLVEMHAGVGGQEAMLFTNEVFAMYQKHFRYKGWNAQVLDCEYSDIGGIKHASISVKGFDAYHRMKFEGGVHRVQRTPTTEKSGRLHTSAMSLAVTLQPSEVEVVLRPQDLKVETCKASGKGGQHVNTTDSAVRIVHIPTGIVVECQKERSQIKNKEFARKILRSKIYERLNDEVMQKYAANRKLQMGSGGRNEKIRTYNFKDDRITDHRINTSVFGLQDFFEGTAKLDSLIDELQESYKSELLVEKIENLVKEFV